MARTRFNGADIVRVLMEHEAGSLVREVCLRYGISARTFYRWKAEWGHEKQTETRSHSALAEENRRLKRLLAETILNAGTSGKSEGPN